MTTLGKWIIAIVALMAVASVIRAITGSGGMGPDSTLEEEAWLTEFVPILSNVNRSGIEPANAMLDVQICETISSCEFALQNMAESLKPYRSSLSFALEGLPRKVPPKFKVFELNYRRMLEFRLEAIELYIRGVAESDDDLLTMGDQKWAEALKASSDYLDQLETILK